MAHSKIYIIKEFENVHGFEAQPVSNKVILEVKDMTRQGFVSIVEIDKFLIERVKDYLTQQKSKYSKIGATVSMISKNIIVQLPKPESSVAFTN